MTDFTPFTSALGGGLIGLAAVAMMALFGRIAGISGFLGSLLPAPKGDAPLSGLERGWRFAFIVGMICAGPGYFLITGAMPVLEVPVTFAGLVLGGVLVGYGVSVGSGCTSGHGVCGLARFSARSVAATLTFMAAAAATVFITRHVIGG